MNNRRVIFDQWKDRTQEPVIIWVHDGYWQCVPVAVDDSHESDLYQEYAAAFFAAHAYQTREELEDEFSEDYTPDEISELYSTDRAGRAGLPVEWYAEGVEEYGDDAIIYVTPETYAESHRETLDEAIPYLDFEDVAEIFRAMLDARKEYEA